jgi:hypothetical protein
MKKNITLFISAAATILLSNALVFAQGDSLSGTYQVLKGDCSTMGAPLMVGEEETVQADASGFRVGTTLYTGDGGAGSKPYFSAAFSFPVGNERVNCLGDCFLNYAGSYSSDGSQFKDVETAAETNTSTPVYAGEFDFALNNDTLEIDVTSGGQFFPVPSTTCVLKKISSNR